MRWLGIDGGGTKTAFSVYDDDMAPLERFTLPTCHYAQAGYEGMREVLARGVNAARRTGLLGDDWGLGIGMCGYGEVAEATRRMDEAAAEVSCGRPFEIVNDVESAWAAGLALADGIVLIAGTGSIAYGRRRGRSMRCGGWDYELGDEGSGGWLGKELLRAFTRQSDGRDEPGPLADIVRRELGLEDDFDLISFAQEHFADRSRISALAPLVSEAARAGDRSASGILERAAREEADMVAAIVRGLFADGDDPVPVAYVGGTFGAGEPLLGPLARALPERCVLQKPVCEPDRGACLLLRARLEGDAHGRAHTAR